MKKIMIFILMAITIGIGTLNLYAESDTVITEETTELLDSEITLNGDVYSSENNDSTVPYNEITFNMTNVYDRLSWYSDNTDNIDSIYIEFVITYLSNNIGTTWSSDNDNFTLVSEGNVRSDGALYDVVRFYVDSDVMSCNFYESIGGTQTDWLTKYGVLINNFVVTVNYINPITNIVDVGTDYDQLPSLDNDYASINYMEDLGNGYIKYGYYDENTYTNYRFDMMEQSYYSDGYTMNDFYFQSNDETKVLYYRGDSTTLYQQNITTSVYNEYNKLKTVGFPTRETNQTAVLYMFLPKSSDFLMSVDLSFQYRIKDLFTGYGDWHTIEKQYDYLNPDNDSWFDYDMTHIAPSRLVLYGMTIFYTAFFSALFLNGYDEQTIQPVEFSEIPTDVTTRYMDYFNSSTDDFDDFNYYRVLLGQIVTATSIGFDIVDLTIINLTFMENGDLITVPQEYIDQQIGDYIEPNQDLSEIADHITTYVSNVFDSISKVGQIVMASFTVVIILFVVVFFSRIFRRNSAPMKSKWKGRKYKYRR